MTTRGSGAGYIVTSGCKVIAATATVSTVYIDIYSGLRGLLLPPLTCTVLVASVRGTEESGSWQSQGKVDASLKSAYLLKLSYIFWCQQGIVSFVLNYPSPYLEFHKSQYDTYYDQLSLSAMCCCHNLDTKPFDRRHSCLQRLWTPHQYEYNTKQSTLFSFYVYLWKAALVKWSSSLQWQWQAFKEVLMERAQCWDNN